MIRRVTEEDIPWLHELCSKAYPPGYFDSVAAETWVRSLLTAGHCLMLRGDRSWLAISVSGLPWNPAQKEARFLPVASLGKASRELLEMTREAIAWSKEQGAVRFYFVAITGTDLGPLARRFGAVPVSPSYVLDLVNV